MCRTARERTCAPAILQGQTSAAVAIGAHRASTVEIILIVESISQAEHDVGAQQTFRFRRTGNLKGKFGEAGQVLGTKINYRSSSRSSTTGCLAKRLPRRA